MAYHKRQQLYKNVQECELAILPFTKSPEACISLFSIGAYDHGKEYHQGLTNDQLTKRAQDDKTKKVVSSFYRPMENLLRSSLKANYKQIAEWFVNPPDRDNPRYKADEYDEDSFKLTTCFSHPIGRGIDAATRSEYDCRVASFIICRDNVLNDGSIGIRVKTAYPDVEKALEYERDAEKAGLVESHGHYCYDHNFVIHETTEMSAAKTQEARFATVASIMNNWQPDYDLVDNRNRDRLSYYSPNNHVVVIATKNRKNFIVLNENFSVSARMTMNGKETTVKPTTLTAKYPELKPYMDKLIELVHMSKDKSVTINEPETISEAENDGLIEYLSTTHNVDHLLDLKTRTKVSITFPDTLEFADGYILHADNYKNGKKQNETLFVYQDTGERRTLDPEGFGVEYIIEEYDSRPGPNARDHSTNETHEDIVKQPAQSHDLDVHDQSYDTR